MMNWNPRGNQLEDDQRLHRQSGRKTTFAALFAILVMALSLVFLWVEPLAAQAIGPVYALPGTLTPAVNRPYGTIITIASGQQFGLVGQTPEIEAQIVQYRSQGEDFEVKVWGDRYPAAIENDLQIIIASSIQPATVTPEATTPPPATAEPTETTVPAGEPTPTPTPAPTTVPTPAVPIAVVTAANVNMRSGPSTDYPVIGGVVAGQTCAVIGRNQSATWWQLSCPGVGNGWVFGELLALAGPVSTVQVVQTAPPPTPTPAATFPNAWRSVFYSGRDLSGPPLLAFDSPTLNFNWGDGSPGENVPSDNFSARFERNFDFSYGTYELSVTMDDGARVFVNDLVAIDAWNVSPTRTRTARLVLSGHTRLRVEYFEATGHAEIQFSINLVSSNEVWRASYYSGQNIGGTPLLVRGEPHGGSAPLDYNWGGGSPAPGIVPEDLFSARWEGTFNFQGGDYRFHANSDDGIRVWIDGILILDRWANGNHQLSNTFRELGGGNHHITVEYYENFGDARVRLWWERIGDGGSGGGGNGGLPRDE